MLHNIVDHRTNTHDNEVDAVFESGWHDNFIDGATKAPKTNNSIVDCQHQMGRASNCISL
jgi:hypothetical protein